MDAQKVMKLAPMLVMLAALACATYAVQPEGPGLAAVAVAGAEKRAAAGKASPPAAPQARAPSEPAGAPRDPFQVVSKPAQAGAGLEQADAVADRADADPHLDTVKGLTL